MPLILFKIFTILFQKFFVHILRNGFIDAEILDASLISILTSEYHFHINYIIAFDVSP